MLETYGLHVATTQQATRDHGSHSSYGTPSCATLFIAVITKAQLQLTLVSSYSNVIYYSAVSYSALLTSVSSYSNVTYCFATLISHELFSAQVPSFRNYVPKCLLDSCFRCVHRSRNWQPTLRYTRALQSIGALWLAPSIIHTTCLGLSFIRTLIMYLCSVMWPVKILCRLRLKFFLYVSSLPKFPSLLPYSKFVLFSSTHISSYTSPALLRTGSPNGKSPTSCPTTAGFESRQPFELGCFCGFLHPLRVTVEIAPTQPHSSFLPCSSQFDARM